MSCVYRVKLNVRIHRRLTYPDPCEKSLSHARGVAAMSMSSQCISARKTPFSTLASTFSSVCGDIVLLYTTYNDFNLHLFITLTPLAGKRYASPLPAEVPSPPCCAASWPERK